MVLILHKRPLFLDEQILTPVDFSEVLKTRFLSRKTLYNHICGNFEVFAETGFYTWAHVCSSCGGGDDHCL